LNRRANDAGAWDAETMPKADMITTLSLRLSSEQEKRLTALASRQGSHRHPASFR
jgi:hypothetical protein